MPKALILDQNPAIQALANHCLKQRGFEPVARSGSLRPLVDELSPQIVIAAADAVTDLQELAKKFGTKFLLVGASAASPPLCVKFIQKPFNSEQLQARLDELLRVELPIEPLVEVSLKISDGYTLELIQMALEARGVTVAIAAEGAIATAQYLITDERASDRLTWYEPEMGEVIEIDPADRDISTSLFERLKPLLATKAAPTAALPLSSQERAVLTKALLKEIEVTLNKTPALRNRKWDEVCVQLNETIQAFFKN